MTTTHFIERINVWLPADDETTISYRKLSPMMTKIAAAVHAVCDEKNEAGQLKIDDDTVDKAGDLLTAVLTKFYESTGSSDLLPVILGEFVDQILRSLCYEEMDRARYR
jgi:hypothetical protein